MNMLLPWSSWMYMITRNNLRCDLLAGLTGALIVLPQGIAYAAIAGLPPEFGLYCAVGPTIVAALFGSSWHLVSGPTAAISIVVFSTLAPLATPGSLEYVSLALALGLMVGLIQLGIGISRLGQLAHYISHSVIVGFTSGAAFLIAASQLKHFFGLQGMHASGFFGQLWEAAMALPSAKWDVTLVGATALLVACAVQRIRKGLPHMIIAMAVASVVGAVIGGVPTVGALPGALPVLSLPAVSLFNVGELSISALIIAVLAITEAIAISRAVSLRSGQNIDCNQEIIGQGLSNIVGSFLSSYPSSGSFTRSGLNFDAGAKTPLAAVFSACFLVSILALISDWLSYLPIAAMSGVLFLVARSLIDGGELKKILQGPRAEAIVLLVTFLSTLLVSLEYAVFIGIGVSLLFRRFGLQAEDDSGHGID